MNMSRHQVLKRPIHSGPTPNDTLPRLTNAYYITIIDGSSGYHNLKLNQISSYLATFACVNLAGTDSPDYCLEWHQQVLVPAKIGKLFKDPLNVFGIADDILIVGYDSDGRDHDRTLRM